MRNHGSIIITVFILLSSGFYEGDDIRGVYSTFVEARVKAEENSKHVYLDKIQEWKDDELLNTWERRSLYDWDLN